MQLDCMGKVGFSGEGLSADIFLQVNPVLRKPSGHNSAAELQKSK